MNGTNTTIDSLSCYGMRMLQFKLTPLAKSWSATTMIFSIISSISSTALNLMVLFVLVKNKHLQTSTNVLFGILALFDLYSGLFVQPLNAIIRTHDIQDVHNCKLKLAFSIQNQLISGISGIIIIVISVARSIRVSSRTVPTSLLDKKILKKYMTFLTALLIIWTVFIGLVQAKVIPLMVMQFVIVFMIIFGLGVTIFGYVRIYYLANKSNVAVQPGSNSSAANQMRRRREQLRLFRIILVIVLVHLFVYSGRLVCIIRKLFNRNLTFSDNYICSKSATALTFLSSIINPLIYSMFVKDIRLNVKLMWMSIFTKLGCL